MPTYSSYWPKTAKRWDAMQRTRKSAEDAAAKTIVANKSRYQTIEAKTGVPWYMIGLIHMRESSFDFTTQLGQGDPLNRVSTHVPKGMGPYFGADAFERAAIEALEHDGLTNVHDWRLEKELYYLEKYNGWGYWDMGRVSPYIFAGSDQYTSGKYISDRNFSSSAIDEQLGVAPVLKSIMDLDSSVSPKRETPEGVEDTPVPTPIPPPVVPIPPLKPTPPIPTTETPMPWLALLGKYGPLLLQLGPTGMKIISAVFQIWRDWDKVKASSTGFAQLEAIVPDLPDLFKQLGNPPSA